MAAATHVWADPITAGSLSFPGGRVTLATDSFTFEGQVSPWSGVFRPADCALPVCVGGGSVDLTAAWVGMDLPGTATWEGETFTNVGSAASSTSLLANWMGTLFIPTDFGGGTLTAPFEFLGMFFVMDASGVTRTLDLAGAGTATATFVPHLTPGAFALESIRYDFEPVATPEPASLLLVATGLAAAALRRRRPPAK